MNSINLNKNINVYLLSSVLVTMAYSLPHSVLTVLLISKGISLSQILVIQSAYSLAIILFEFPSGVIADIYSKKSVYLISKSLMILLFFIIIVSNHFLILYLAWFIYGMAAALDSGTIDADLFNQIKTSKESDLNHFIAIDSRISIISLLIGSTLGGVCYTYFGTRIYFLSILLCFLAIILTSLFYQESNIQKKENQIRLENFTAQISNSLKELKNSNIMQFVILLDFLTQIFFQTHFQLWQAFFIEKNISSTFFPIFYIIFQLIALASYSMKFKRFKKIHKFKVLILSLGILPLFLSSNLSYIYISSYILYVFLFYIIQFVLKKYYTQLISKDNISSLISFKETINRLGSIITLILLSILTNYMSVSSLVISNFMFTFFTLTFFGNMLIKRFKTKNSQFIKSS